MHKNDIGYVTSVLIAIDQLGNALTGGHADETISSRMGRAKQRGDLWRILYPLERFLDFWDYNHVLDAIEPEFVRKKHEDS